MVPKPRFTVRPSPIHGRGVFANTTIRAGERIFEYAGELITAAEARRRHEQRSRGHTFLFLLDDGLLVDGGAGGNSSRWLNHSCDPNLVAETVGRRVLITAARDIDAGEELLLDYQLEIDDDDAEEIARSICACGSTSCRRTMRSA